MRERKESGARWLIGVRERDPMADEGRDPLEGFEIEVKGRKNKMNIISMENFLKPL